MFINDAMQKVMSGFLSEFLENVKWQKLQALLNLNVPK